MRTLFVLLALLTSFAGNANLPDSAKSVKFRIGPLAQVGTSIQRAMEGTDYNSEHFGFKKNKVTYGVGLQSRLDHHSGDSLKLGYVYARHANSFSQIGFGELRQTEFNYTIFDMAHEFGLSIHKGLFLNHNSQFSIGAGINYRIHTPSKIVTNSSLGGVDGTNGGGALDLTLIHGDLSKSYSTSAILAEICYLTKILSKRPIEISLQYQYALNAAPVMEINSIAYDANNQQVGEFNGKIVPGNNAVRLGIAYYIFNLKR